MKLDSAVAKDTIAEDASLVIATAEGLIVLAVCGHARSINTVGYPR
jgi:metal-dependent hydrolase (beta-lactamase superfamily II)